MASHPEFGEQTGALEIAEAFADCIRGKTILVTGVSPKGLGASTASAFASQGPSLLILASKTRSKVDEVVQEIRLTNPQLNIQTVLLDLSSQKKIYEAADAIKELTDRLDILVNNAGTCVVTRQKTAEGIELQFGVNHIGPFLLTNLLLPLLEKAAEQAPRGATRIVNVSSAGHRVSPMRFHDYNFEGKPVPAEEEHVQRLPGAFGKFTEDGYNGIVTYAMSKTANILFTLHLQPRLIQRGIAAYAVHPGTIETELGRHQDAELQGQFHKSDLYWKNVDEGSATTLVGALDPALNDPKGVYLAECQYATPSAHASGPESAEKLWELSEHLVGTTFAVGR
ncbi:NAD(P)-binding protein [Thozetella sp. PMI_491]|nr:NAD(P)-binding protein [Thozetella sp. PMI_491]